MSDTILTPPSPPFGEMVEFTDHADGRVYLVLWAGEGEPRSLEIEAEQCGDAGVSEGARVSLTMKQARALRDYLNRLNLA